MTPSRSAHGQTSRTGKARNPSPRPRSSPSRQPRPALGNPRQMGPLAADSSGHRSASASTSVCLGMRLTSGPSLEGAPPAILASLRKAIDVAMALFGGPSRSSAQATVANSAHTYRRSLRRSRGRQCRVSPEDARPGRWCRCSRRRASGQPASLARCPHRVTRPERALLPGWPPGAGRGSSRWIFSPLIPPCASLRRRGSRPGRS
jgi:hypothetical protein